MHLTRPYILIDYFTGIFFPGICTLCRKQLAHTDRIVCKHCLNEIPAPSLTECPFCWIESSHGRCECQEFRQSGLDGLTSGWFYTEGMRNVIHQIKYRGKTRFGVFIGEALYGKCRSAIQDKIDYVVPVPVHHTRKRQRGYNQVELLMSGFCRSNQAPSHLRALKRVKGNPSQTTKDREERRRSIAGNFAIRKKMGHGIEGKRLLVLDDVMTTSSTLSECAKVLRAGGAQKVYAATLARVLPKTHH